MGLRVDIGLEIMTGLGYRGYAAPMVYITVSGLVHRG